MDVCHEIVAFCEADSYVDFEKCCYINMITTTRTLQDDLEFHPFTARDLNAPFFFKVKEKGLNLNMLLEQCLFLLEEGQMENQQLFVYQIIFDKQIMMTHDTENPLLKWRFHRTSLQQVAKLKICLQNTFGHVFKPHTERHTQIFHVRPKLITWVLDGP